MRICWHTVYPTRTEFCRISNDTAHLISLMVIVTNEVLPLTHRISYRSTAESVPRIVRAPAMLAIDIPARLRLYATLGMVSTFWAMSKARAAIIWPTPVNDTQEIATIEDPLLTAHRSVLAAAVRSVFRGKALMLCKGRLPHLHCPCVLVWALSVDSPPRMLDTD